MAIMEMLPIISVIHAIWGVLYVKGVQLFVKGVTQIMGLLYKIMFVFQTVP